MLFFPMLIYWTTILSFNSNSNASNLEKKKEIKNQYIKVLLVPLLAKV